MKGLDFPAFPLTQDKIDDFGNPQKVPFYKFTNELHLMNHGVLFGWLYVCCVWLREADHRLFNAAVRDPDFTSEWTPFLKRRRTVWKDQGEPTLDKMMRHFRNAIAHGNIYINVDEGVRDGEAPHFLLSATDKDHVAVVAQFKASFSDLVRFGEAIYRAHTAATYGKRYRDIDAVPVLRRATHDSVLPTRKT